MNETPVIIRLHLKSLSCLLHLYNYSNMVMVMDNIHWSWIFFYFNNELLALVETSYSLN